MVKGAAGPGVYSATYSNTPVYEFQFGPDLKEHVMRRRSDDWINATHILKAAGFDKPARTRILEREVQKEVHEKVQGGYGKYQGTWVPLEHGQALAVRNGVYEKLRTIFEFVPSNESPPPAPKHTTNKPKVPKKPAVPKFHSMTAPSRVSEDYDNISDQLNDDATPDDTTVASASFMDEDDRYDMSQQSTGHRKRKREGQEQEQIPLHQQNHMAYSDELLDYFLLTQANAFASRPEPPPNFEPDWVIDDEGHTGMHWAAAMADIEVMKQLKRFGADLGYRNNRGETPLMRATMFTNGHDRQTMPKVVQELMGTMDMVDLCNSSALHHAAAVTSSRSKHHIARYYLDVMLNKISETHDREDMQSLLDLQDVNGNTAIHIAAKNKARKCVRALIGRGAATDIVNLENETAEDLIQVLNQTRRERNLHASSSPFAPDSQRRVSFHEPVIEDVVSRHTVAHHSEAAMSVESKVTPLILEKFQKLAESFDEELIELDNSEKEAKRLLNSTQLELTSVLEQIAKLEALEEADVNTEQEEAELERAKQRVVSLVEQQHLVRLSDAVQREEAMANGHMEDESDTTRLNYYTLLEGAQHTRRLLVEEYVQALANAGMGEKVSMYRKLTATCLGLKEEEVDEQLESLLAVLEENRVDGDTAMAD